MSDIIGMVKNHTRFCNVDECKCRELRLESEEGQSQMGNETIGECKKPTERKEEIQRDQLIYIQEKYKGLEQKVYEILNMTLRHLRRKENSADSEIIQGYVNYHMLNRMFNALYNLMLAEECNLTLFQRFQLYCLRCKRLKFHTK